jgi:GR25 family glycosyltransferase involved in LPS biosynthesis
MDSYIISLNNPINLINKVKEFNINPILVKGIKGSDLSNEEIKYNVNDDLFSLINPKSSLGCAMSHLKSWKQFLSSNKNSALFLEDDAIFENNFKVNLTNVLKNTPDDFDILYLGCFFCDKQYNTISTKINDYFGKYKDEIIINDYVKIPQIFFAAHSYILSKKGADKLVKLFEQNLYYHVDFMILQEFYNDNLIVYCSRNRLVYQTSSSNITSSENVSSKHPVLVEYILKPYEVDKHASLNYFKNLSMFRIGDNINCNFMTILFFIIGIVLLFFKVDVKLLTLIYLSLSAYDIYLFNDINMIILHGVLLILPSVIKEANNI